MIVTRIRSPEELAHRERCKRLPALQPGEAENLIAGFLTTRGATLCPQRFAAPVEHRPMLTRSAL